MLDCRKALLDAILAVFKQFLAHVLVVHALLQT